MLCKISPFRNKNNVNNSTPIIYPKSKTTFNTGIDSFSCSINTNIKPNRIKNRISFAGLALMRDYKYHSQLARGINKLFPDLKCQISDLQSIVGASELQRVLKASSAENFSVGGDELANVKSGRFRVNLHSHTSDSDGKLTVEELLSSVAEYADKINKPVYIGITNHDTINGLAEAVKLIATNKEKFKNVRVVLGVEFNAMHEAPESFSKPLQFEMIGYCVNPFDYKLNDLLNGVRTKNVDYAGKIIEKVNEKYGTQLTFDELKDYDSSLKTGGSPSFLWKLKECMIAKLQQSGQSSEYLEELFKTHSDKYGDLRLTEATPSMANIIRVTKNASGIAGIAHPVRNRLGQKINLPTHAEREAKYDEALYAFFQKFKQLGGQILEADYQYKPEHLRHPNKVKKREFVKRICKELGFLSSSGLDNHGRDIFH